MGSIGIHYTVFIHAEDIIGLLKLPRTFFSLNLFALSTDLFSLLFLFWLVHYSQTHTHTHTQLSVVSSFIHGHSIIQ